jgi:hypothetical protein
MFLNTGDSSSTFDHRGSNGSTGSLQGPGLELANNYNIALPTTTEINRPFSLTDNSSPDGWGYMPYSDRFPARLIRTYYTSSVSGYTGSGLIELQSPDGSASAYLTVNGLAQSTALGTGALARYSLLTLVHSYFEAGDTTLPNRIEMTPRAEMLFPNEISELLNPASIDLKFDGVWKRWDGKQYTESTPALFFENEANVDYFLLYSKNNGRTWFSVVMIPRWCRPRGRARPCCTRIRPTASRPMFGPLPQPTSQEGPTSSAWRPTGGTRVSTTPTTRRGSSSTDRGSTGDSRPRALIRRGLPGNTRPG